MEKRNIKIGNKNIKFSYDGPLKAKEVVAIEAYIKGAHELAGKSIELISGESAQGHFESIFGEADAFKQKKVNDAYSAILEKIERGLTIVRSKQFVSKARKFEPETFSSADPKDGKTIKIYDAFFEQHEGDDKGLNERSSVIMHEVAHLIGLTGDCETDSIKSAECLRNFTILACGIVAPEDLFTGESEETEEETKAGKNSKVGINGDLPFNSDQPRQPKGQSNGGQFAPKDGGGDGSNKDGSGESSEKTDASSGTSQTSAATPIGSASKKRFKIQDVESIIEEAMQMLDKMAGEEGKYNDNGLKELLLGTAISETGLRPRKQDHREVMDPETGETKVLQGDAAGLFQMEKRTFDWFLNTYLEKNKPEIAKDIKNAFTPAGGELTQDQLTKDPALGAIMSALYYEWRASRKGTELPKGGDLAAQAKFWKDEYNTAAGRGTPEKYIKDWKYLHSIDKKQK